MEGYSFKDVRDIASASALVAVAISSSYFYSEISQIKEDQETMKKHLASVISLVDPDKIKLVDDAVGALKLLDSKLAKAQDDIKYMQSTIPGFNDGQSNRKIYYRLTNKDGKEPYTFNLNQTHNDFDDDVAAMQ